ncbi:hypothetical protein GH714_036328 [Hevea brasiliensis]|uniref:NB-ARC domain-containing protein n=1 Tax=Hevea brasiliensis TaxID=3981 RepID=A0A6A6L932_HEVBR|nr:hypothetical protein GH714_036328 [Hevea brasiliensis]
MIQVSQRNPTGIGIKTCRVHDLMRDICILKAKEENFLGFLSTTESTQQKTVRPPPPLHTYRQEYISRNRGSRGRSAFFHFWIGSSSFLEDEDSWQLFEFGATFSLPSIDQVRVRRSHTRISQLGQLTTKSCQVNFVDSALKQDPMCILEKLQHLRFLSLENNVYEGSEMVCSATGFLQLETLTLKSFGLEKWEIEEGAMPCLKSLSLSLGELKMIPEGLRFVTTVRELKLIHMVTCEERVRGVNGVEGVDFHKVRHIPSISFN